MSDKNAILRKRAERNKAKALEYARRAQLAEKTLSERERRADTRRKILDGVHIQTEALNNPEIAKLLAKLRDEKLILDHDRALFGLAPIGEEEKDRRMGKTSAPRKRKVVQDAPESEGSKEMEAA